MPHPTRRRRRATLAAMAGSFIPLIAVPVSGDSALSAAERFVYGPGATARIARLTVQDQGPGIAPEDRERVWEPFVRLGRHAGTTAGSGIGLAVVRGIVERHGGRITVENAPGGGARFVVELEISESAAGLPWRATGEWNVRAPMR